MTFPEWLRGGETIDWADARAKLVDSRNYWIASVRNDGVPHTRPVWGVCTDDCLMVSPGGGYWTMRNVRARPKISVHPEAAEGIVVVVEGVAAPLEANERGTRALAAYNSKYGENYSLDDSGGGIIDVTPTRVYAWETGGEAFRGTRYDF